MEDFHVLTVLGKILVFGMTGVLGTVLFFQALGGNRVPRLLTGLLRLENPEGQGDHQE